MYPKSHPGVRDEMRKRQKHKNPDEIIRRWVYATLGDEDEEDTRKIMFQIIQEATSINNGIEICYRFRGS